MRDLNQDKAEGTPRRGFFGIAAMSALGLFGFATATTQAQAAPSDGPDWPGALKGRHKQLFDVYTINAGFPLGFVNNFLTPNESATAVMIFRHQGLPYALNSMIWAKYKVGETFKIIDPETKGPAVKNPWFERPAGPKCGRDRRRSVEGIHSEFDPGHHRAAFGNMGRESGPGSRLHLLRRRLDGLKS